MGVWAALAQALRDVGAAGADAFERVREAVGAGQSREAAISMAVVALAAKMAKAAPSDSTALSANT